MNEEIVTYETAVLAYNKGFIDTISCIGGKNYYNYKGELNGDCTELLKETFRAKKEQNDIDDFYINIPAPTQSLLQKWLREKYDIHILVVSSNISGYNYAVNNKKGLLGISTKEFPYKTYEEALEAALLEGLKMI